MGAALVKEAHQTGKTVREVAREKSGIPEERLALIRSQALPASRMARCPSWFRIGIGP